MEINLHLNINNYQISSSSVMFSWDFVFETVNGIYIAGNKSKIQRFIWDDYYSDSLNLIAWS